MAIEPPILKQIERLRSGIELNPAYYLDGAAYYAAAVRERSMPGLFDILEENAA